MGSITHVTDEEGNLFNRYEYDAWGNLTVEEEQVSNRFKYTGEQFDAITQQYYLRARFYNPALARFMQEDTFRGDGLNLYAYCANNPVRYVDPSGHQCKKKNNSQNQSDEYDINNTDSEMSTNGKEIPLLPGPVMTGQNRLQGPVADTPDDGRRGAGESNADLPQQAGKGQSRGGRHEPANLNEKLAMEEAMTNPESGMSLEGKNTDPRWTAEEGWEKWAQNVNGNEIHYQYNPLTGEIDDVKIK